MHFYSDGYKYKIIILYFMVILYLYFNFQDLLLDYSELIPGIVLLCLIPKHIKGHKSEKL